MAKGANQVSLTVAVVICLTISLRGSDALPSGIPDRFYEFGTTANDTALWANDDGYTYIGLSSPFPFFGSVYNGMYVSSDFILLCLLFIVVAFNNYISILLFQEILSQSWDLHYVLFYLNVWKSKRISSCNNLYHGVVRRHSRRTVRH